MKTETLRLPETVTAPRTDPIYNCHAYLTKVPIGAIQPFIQTFTKPGEVVADFFAGSGMTGLTALTLNRRARLSDISVLGKHIATGYLTDAPARDIRAAAHRFYSDMNLFQEAWLGEATNHAHEAVVHTTGKRMNGSGERYEGLLRGAFSEAFRVLKPGR